MNTASIKKTGLGILIGVLLMIGVQFASAAFPMPTGTPPNGNVDAPVNTGSIQQFKNGILSTLGLFTLDLGAFSQLIPTPVGISVNSGGVKIFDGVTPTPGEVLTVGTNNVVSWQPGAAALPVGAIDQTLRHDGSVWVTTGIAGLKNSGTDIYQGVPDTSVGQGDYPVGNDGEVKINDPLYVGNNLGVIGKAKIYGNTQVGASATSPALDIAGKIKIVDGTQAAGRILTSNAAGLASWIEPSNTIPSVQKEFFVWDSNIRNPDGTATCNTPGAIAVGGGVKCSAGAAISASEPFTSSWYGRCAGPIGSNVRIDVYVVCMDFTP